MLDAGDAGDRVLDLLGDLRFQFGRRRARLVIITWTTGTSMLGKRVIGSVVKLIQPSTISTKNSTSEGIGRRIDQAEMFIIEPR